MNGKPLDGRRFVVCVEVPTEYSLDLALHKIYEVIPDERAERRGSLRIVDETGEDYLYPDEWFRAIEVPHALSRELRKAS